MTSYEVEVCVERRRVVELDSDGHACCCLRGLILAVGVIDNVCSGIDGGVNFVVVELVLASQTLSALCS